MLAKRNRDIVGLSGHRSVLRPILLLYYVLALTCSPLNRLLFGDFETAISVSYFPLVILLLAYSIQFLIWGLDRALIGLLVGLLVITAISVGHSISSFDPFLIKCPLFFLFALLVAANSTHSDISAITRVTSLCAAGYVCVGILLWYTNVYGELLTPASFAEAMFFKKQEYTVILTLLAGMCLYELLLSGKAASSRRRIVALQATAIGIGMALFYIKSLLVVLAVSMTTLWLLRAPGARKYVAGMGAGLVVLYFTYDRLILAGWFPEHVIAYVAWLFDDRFVTVEGARNLDTLTMRLAILTDNVDAMRDRISSMFFGIGTNTAAHASFTSYLSGRERDLPIEMESGLLQMFVYLGGVGFSVYLFSYVYAFKVWMDARRRYSAESIALFSQVVAVNLALLASNIFQDNLASVTWYWLGLLWYCVVVYQQTERRSVQVVDRMPSVNVLGHRLAP